jgi:hypothetical protein
VVERLEGAGAMRSPTRLARMRPRSSVIGPLPRQAAGRPRRRSRAGDADRSSGAGTAVPKLDLGSIVIAESWDGRIAIRPGDRRDMQRWQRAAQRARGGARLRPRSRPPVTKSAELPDPGAKATLGENVNPITTSLPAPLRPACPIRPSRPGSFRLS